MPCVFLRSARQPEGRVVPQAEAVISPQDRGFTLGDGVYEVIRAYSGRLFRPEAHIARLAHSLAAARIELPDVDRLAPVGRELLRQNDLLRQDATVYIQVTRGIHPRMARLSGPPPLPTVYVETAPLATDLAMQQAGVSAITLPDERWARCDIKSIGLLANVLARLEADRHGAGEAVFIRDGAVTEGTHTSVFGVRSGTVLTHPADHHILPGITRQVVLELLPALGVPVTETAVRESDLSRLDELFLACTTGEVIPVVQVDGRSIGRGAPGAVTRRLQAAFREHVRASLGLD
jgi:D-alanine transaminase